MRDEIELTWDGRDHDGPTVLLAHGAGAGADSAFLVDAAAALAARGLRVARFEFDYMAARRQGVRRGPDPAPKLLACFRRAIAATGVEAKTLLLAGKSMGGRMATMLADEAGVAGVIVFGYPFHPPGKPTQLRTDHLRTMHTRCLIVQGERDPFGTRDEVPGYGLAPAIEVVWLADGDHSFVARKGRGGDTRQNLDTAFARAAAFASTKVR